MEEEANTNTNTKEELIANIKEWIKIDNELIKIKLDVKEKTNKKKQLTESLVKIMKINNFNAIIIEES